MAEPKVGWLTLSQDQPAAIVLSRQALPTLDRSKYASAAGVHKVGGFVPQAD